MKLSEDNFSRLAYHLGYNAGSIPDGDWNRLITASETIPSKFYHDRIVERLDRCDRAERASELLSVPRSRIESIGGDVIRTIAITDAEQAKQTYADNYLRETNELAQALYVPNYRDPLQSRYRWERSGIEYLDLGNGPPDTTVSDKIYLYKTWGRK
jgi:hypothetical protein